jgi:hypothetical protein
LCIDPPDNSELLALLNEKEAAVDYGPPVLEAVAKGLEKSVSRSLSKDAVDNLKERMRAPENAKLLSSPKVNPEVWNSLPNGAKFADLRLQQHQTTISHGLITLAKIADQLARPQISPKDMSNAIMQHVKDGANLLGKGFQDLTSRRRAELRQHIQPEYSGICSSSYPASEFLFGDNFEELLKKSKASSDLTKKVSSRFRGHTSKPYLRSSPSSSLNYTRPSPGSYRRGGPNRGNFRQNWRGQRQSHQKPSFQQ